MRYHPLMIVFSILQELFEWMDNLMLIKFNEGEIKTFIHAQKGIYLLFINDAIHYIGVSKNMRIRLLQQLKRDEFEKITDVLVLPIENDDVRAIVEKELIYSIKPEINQNYIHYNHT